MEIWELMPESLDHRNWETSTYKGRVVLRADDEDRVRDIATSAFCIATVRDISRDTPLNPWTDKNLVVCQQLADGGYDHSGPETILEPEEYDHEWQR